MSEKQKPSSIQGEQLKAAMGSMATMGAALREQMAKDDVSKGTHVTKILKAPTTDGFGTFTQKWEFVAGCEPLEQLNAFGAGEIRVNLTDTTGKKKIISIGRTPREWDPQQGGKIVADAGHPSNYLMAVADVDAAQTTIEATRFRYLDEADLTGVRFVNGAPFALGLNHALGRQITSPGAIEATSALVA